MSVRFRAYESPRDGIAFRELNEEWILSQFGAFEPKDREVLNDPETHILGEGGRIFFLEEASKLVGCVALIPAEAGALELAKMAVAPDARGHGLGRKLLHHAIIEAHRMGAVRLVLGTNTKLAAAMHLYREAGFKPLPPENLQCCGYERANLLVALELES